MNDIQLQQPPFALLSYSSASSGQSLRQLTGVGYSAYPDKNLDVFSIATSLQNPDDPDGPPITALNDRIFIELQTGGEKYLIHAQDHEGILNADVSGPGFGNMGRDRRSMTETDIQTVRNHVCESLPNNPELRAALDRPNGLRTFLGID